jgi:hypothetical protein
MKNYYFTIGVSLDCDFMDFDDRPDFGDEDDQYIYDLIDSADYIYLCSSNNVLTSEKLQNMIFNSIENITNRKSKVFDYSEFEEDSEIDEFDVSEEDIMYELQDLYDVETGRSFIPLIWGDDVWENDEDYDIDNPPELWRMYLHD